MLRTTVLFLARLCLLANQQDGCHEGTPLIMVRKSPICHPSLQAYYSAWHARRASCACVESLRLARPARCQEGHHVVTASPQRMPLWHAPSLEICQNRDHPYTTIAAYMKSLQSAVAGVLTASPQLCACSKSGVPRVTPECASHLDHDGRLHEQLAASGASAGGPIAGVAEVSAVL